MCLVCECFLCLIYSAKLSWCVCVCVDMCVETPFEGRSRVCRVKIFQTRASICTSAPEQ